MAGPDDLETRVTALETRYRELSDRVRHSEQDAAAARVLAGGADRDVNEIRGELRDFRRATTAGFNAMREDLTDLRQHVDNGFAEVSNGFAEVSSRFAEVNNRFAEVDTGFAEVRGRLDGTAAGQQQIVELLHTLIRQEGDGNS